MVEFDRNWAFLDCNSSLNSPMAMKCCTKLETAKERCPMINNYYQCIKANGKFIMRKIRPCLGTLMRSILNSMWPYDAMWQHRSGSYLLPDGTKQLPEPMLTFHQYSPMTFIWGQFHLSQQSPKLAWKLDILWSIILRTKMLIRNEISSKIDYDDAVDFQL